MGLLWYRKAPARCRGFWEGLFLIEHEVDVLHGRTVVAVRAIRAISFERTIRAHHYGKRLVALRTAERGLWHDCPVSGILAFDAENNAITPHTKCGVTRRTRSQLQVF